MAAGQYANPEQVIVHLSDLHLVAAPRLLLGAVDADAQLVLAVEAVRASGVAPAAIVVTGDVADAGEPDAYARARALLEPLAAELGARLVWVIGNHDRPAAFSSGLLGGRVDGPLDSA
jgi:3',5'-cyclic AMP phosphodiesterase CpdA